MDRETDGMEKEERESYERKSHERDMIMESSI